ncbi:hypothetical protein L218DRAFT_476168 [Marasmius fiardii PR-910]|nr:hypothetical protein L218DRAFT_476168 [Marasmius fiardii PR-910]
MRSTNRELEPKVNFERHLILHTLVIDCSIRGNRIGNRVRASTLHTSADGPTTGNDYTSNFDMHISASGGFLFRVSGKFPGTLGNLYILSIPLSPGAPIIWYVDKTDRSRFRRAQESARGSFTRNERRPEETPSDDSSKLSIPHIVQHSQFTNPNRWGLSLRLKPQISYTPYGYRR